MIAQHKYWQYSQKNYFYLDKSWGYYKYHESNDSPINQKVAALNRNPYIFPYMTPGSKALPKL